MKITNMAIAFVLIVFPFFIVLDLRTDAMSKTGTIEDQYDVALKTASQDAAMILNINELQEYEVEYQSKKEFRVNKELAIDTFFRSLYLNFGVDKDAIGQGTLMAYIPALIVVDYDGYWLYVMSEYKDSSGNTVYKHVWQPKKPYAFSDKNGNSINFTLDGYVHAYDSIRKEWIEGFQEDLQGQTNIELLNDSNSFEEKRRSIIVGSIQEDLTYFIDKHNEYSSRNGISYIFKLPIISHEDWTNTVDDIGIMGFIQGIPIGDQYYNNYAFGSGRLILRPIINGGVDDNTGMKYYYRDSCSLPYRVEEIFNSEKDAAAAGYFPKDCINKRP